MLDQLVEAWQLRLSLGWEAFQTGNPPIGAVVTDEDGAVVAFGRSRRFDISPPNGQLGGTSIAHAEINALAQLSPGRYAGHTLWTSLEPCPMCAAATMSTGIGRVRFAAPDPMWSGAERLPELNTAVADRWPTSTSGHCRDGLNSGRHCSRSSSSSAAIRTVEPSKRDASATR